MELTNLNLFDKTILVSLQEEFSPEELAIFVEELEYKERYNKIETIFMEGGKAARKFYKKHLEFFKAGATHMIRLFMAANRVGKTWAAGVEVTYHLTGDYPDWWEGHRFSGPSNWWIVSHSSSTSQQIIQNLLLGPVGDFGSGLIPKHQLDFSTLTAATKSGTHITSWRVHHVSGGYSTVELKSAESGVKAFEGTERSIWIDEECPQPVYAECLTRTATGNNILLMTFTPLKGLTDVVLSFLNDNDIYAEGETGTGKYVVRCGWDDVPHIGEREKAALSEEFKKTPHLFEAKTKGIPSLGDGAVFPYAESTYHIDPFEIPKHWPKAYGMDTGRNTAAVFFAHDRDSNIIYIYGEYFNGSEMAVPSTHAASIKARGAWLRGAIDPAGRGRSATDGQNVVRMLQENGLNLINADKSVEAGLETLCELLNQGRLKIFKTCTQLITEIRLYRREKGQIVKKNDHLVDSMRYGIFNRDKILRTEAEANAPTVDMNRFSQQHNPWKI